MSGHIPHLQYNSPFSGGYALAFAKLFKNGGNPPPKLGFP